MGFMNKNITAAQSELQIYYFFLINKTTKNTKTPATRGKKKVICAQLFIYLGICINSGQKMKVLLLAQHSSAMTFYQ